MNSDIVLMLQSKPVQINFWKWIIIFPTVYTCNNFLTAALCKHNDNPEVLFQYVFSLPEHAYLHY